jgi:hypothetical protein
VRILSLTQKTKRTRHTREHEARRFGDNATAADGRERLVVLFAFGAHEFGVERHERTCERIKTDARANA